jgi:hypothetical protein
VGVGVGVEVDLGPRIVVAMESHHECDGGSFVTRLCRRVRCLFSR